MRMEELLSAAADEMENKQRSSPDSSGREKRKSNNNGNSSDLYLMSGDTDGEKHISTTTTTTSSTSATTKYSTSSPLVQSSITTSSTPSSSSDKSITLSNEITYADNKNKSTYNSYNSNNNNNNNTTTSKTKSPLVSPRNSIRTRSKRDTPPPLAIDPDSEHTPSSSSTPSSTPVSATSSPSSSSNPPTANVLCKTPGCVVCLKGPPSSFSKGTPIWAQILHLVLYALTESARVHVVGSPKMKVKRYFHLRDDIYEYISIHWDVICRRERIKNWRHTIGMTLSHYQNLFQNGYHIYQNTGYWSMKDNVPSPYQIDPLVGEGASPGKKRKYNSKTSADKELKDSNMTPFISDFPISPLTDGTTSTTTTTTTTTTTSTDNENDSKDSEDDGVKPQPSSSSSSHFSHHPITGLSSSSQSMMPSSAIKFDEMKNEIDRFKKEMGSLQSEIDALQEQLQVKKAEEHLLKFLQEGISSFRDKIKQRIELLRTEMINNHSEHQHQIHTMASELTQLREIGADLRNAFQYQFTRLAHLNSSQLQV